MTKSRLCEKIHTFTDSEIDVAIEELVLTKAKRRKLVAGIDCNLPKVLRLHKKVHGDLLSV